MSTVKPVSLILCTKQYTEAWLDQIHHSTFPQLPPTPQNTIPPQPIGDPLTTQLHHLANAIAAQNVTETGGQSVTDKEFKKFLALPEVTRNTVTLFSLSEHQDACDLEVLCHVQNLISLLQHSLGTTIQRTLHLEARKRGLRLHAQIGLCTNPKTAKIAATSP